MCKFILQVLRILVPASEGKVGLLVAELLRLAELRQPLQPITHVSFQQDYVGLISCDGGVDQVDHFLVGALGFANAELGQK